MVKMIVFALKMLDLYYSCKHVRFCIENVGSFTEDIRFCIENQAVALRSGQLPIASIVIPTVTAPPSC